MVEAFLCFMANHGVENSAHAPVLRSTESGLLHGSLWVVSSALLCYIWSINV